MRGKFPFIIILCFVSILAPFFARVLLAGDPADIGEIEVSDRMSQESAKAPSSFSTIITPKRESSDFKGVSELIGASVGTTAKSLGGLGQFSTVSIRGSEPVQVGVYLDGVKLNSASGGAFDFSTIPADSIERIEVVRGGGTTQFGSDAVGGVINLISKKAAGKRQVEVFGGGGSFTTIKLGASYSEKLKNDNLLFAWNQMQSHGDFTFKTNNIRLNGAPSGLGGGRTYTRLHNGFLSEALLSKWSHDITDDVSISVLNDFFFTDRDVPGTEEETTLLYPSNGLDAKEKIFRNTSSVALKAAPFFNDALSLEWSAFNNLDIDFFKALTPAIGNPIDVRTNNDSVGSNASLSALLDHKIASQLLTLKYSYRFDYLSDSSPLANTVLTGTKTRNTNSVFLQDEISFLKERIIILPAVRFEDATAFKRDMSWRGGLKILPVKFLTLKANIERSFRYPSFSELYFPDQGYIRGNPDLKKEEALNLDAGFSIDTKYAGIQAAYFKNWIDNSILFVPISAVTIAPVNTFRVNSYGIEVSGTLDPIKYVHVGANYTYLSARYASNGKQLPGRPKNEVGARLELRHTIGRVEGTLFGNYSYKSALPLNPENTVFLAPVSIIDAGATVKFLERYIITIEAKDLTNVQSYDVRGFPLPRRSYFGTFGIKWS